MKKNYELECMSCGGCVANVKNAFLQVPDVTEAEVKLHPQRAALTMSKPFDVKMLQTRISKSGPYMIKALVTNINQV